MFYQLFHFKRWHGYLPFYLPLIICNYVMNTIMHIMIFILIICIVHGIDQSVLCILDICFSQLQMLQQLHMIFSFCLFQDGGLLVKLGRSFFSGSFLGYLASWKLKHTQNDAEYTEQRLKCGKKQSTRILCTATVENRFHI